MCQNGHSMRFMDEPNDVQTLGKKCRLTLSTRMDTGTARLDEELHRQPRTSIQSTCVWFFFSFIDPDFTASRNVLPQLFETTLFLDGNCPQRTETFQIANAYIYAVCTMRFVTSNVNGIAMFLRTKIAVFWDWRRTDGAELTENL